MCELERSEIRLMVFNDAQELLLLRQGGTWTLPAGAPRPGQLPAVSGLRVLRHRTGVSADLVAGGLFGVLPPERHLLYVATSVGTGTDGAASCDVFRWVSPAEAERLPLTHPLIPALAGAARLWARAMQAPS